MVADRAATQEKRQAAIPPVAIVIALMLLVGLAGFWYLNRPPVQAQPAVLTGPAKEYVKYLRFVSADGQTAESPQMEAHESYLGQSVVEITGNIKNTGDRVLNVVEINWIFYDRTAAWAPNGEAYTPVVLKKRLPIVTKKMGGLAPGETKSFRVAFDDVPDSWNQAMPSMVIAAIDFS